MLLNKTVVHTSSTVCSHQNIASACAVPARIVLVVNSSSCSGSSIVDFHRAMAMYTRKGSELIMMSSFHT